MQLSVEVFRDLIGTIAIMALLSVAYGAVMRAFKRRWLSHSILGTLFGAVAVFAVYSPFRIAEGVLVDLRSVPVVLAGAFLGPEGAAAAVMMTISARVAAGGVGTMAGLVSILLSGAVGLAWSSLRLRMALRFWSGLPLLAALSCSVFLAGVLLPAEPRRQFLFEVIPLVAPLHALGILVVGSLLQRERRFLEGERRLTREAQHDLLTGVLNRRGFELAAVQAGQGQASAALILLDLDHFKLINDRFGHEAGDAVLREIGRRLGPRLRSSDVLGRVGGEEFAIYLPAISPLGVERIALRLCEALRSTPFDLPDGDRLIVTGSIGAVWTDTAWDLQALLREADAALYLAKAQGRDRHVIQVQTKIPDEPLALDLA